MLKRFMAVTGVAFVLALGGAGAALAASPTATTANHHVDLGKKHPKPHTHKPPKKSGGGGW